MKTVGKWHSDRVQREVTLVRWGNFGQPVIVFPTAGGDAEEIERMHLVGAVRCRTEPIESVPSPRCSPSSPTSS